jgi:hypothetical protein
LAPFWRFGILIAAFSAFEEGRTGDDDDWEQTFGRDLLLEEAGVLEGLEGWVKVFL